MIAMQAVSSSFVQSDSLPSRHHDLALHLELTHYPVKVSFKLKHLIPKDIRMCVHQFQRNAKIWLSQSCHVVARPGLGYESCQTMRPCSLFCFPKCFLRPDN